MLALELKLDIKRMAINKTLLAQKRLDAEAAQLKTKATKKQLIDKKNLEIKLSNVANTANPSLLMQRHNDIMNQKAALQKKILNDKMALKKHLDLTEFNVKMAMQNKPC